MTTKTHTHLSCCAGTEHCCCGYACACHYDHTAYPHLPGTLHDCAACEMQPCEHPAGEGDGWCVSTHHVDGQ